MFHVNVFYCVALLMSLFAKLDGTHQLTVPRSHAELALVRGWRTDHIHVRQSYVSVEIDVTCGQTITTVFVMKIIERY